jgi:hypothetical protein
MSTRALRLPIAAAPRAATSLTAAAATALAAGAAIYLAFLAVAFAAPPGVPVDLSHNYAASPGFVAEIWLNNLAIAGAVWALWAVFARRGEWERLRVPFIALLVGIGSLWAIRAGLAAADLGGRDLGVGAVIAETAPHAIPELALIAVPAAFARKGARPSLLLLAGIAAGLLVCAVVEGYV